MIPKTNVQKLEYAIGQLHRAQAYVESSLRIAEEYMNEVIKEQKNHSE